MSCRPLRETFELSASPSRGPGPHSALHGGSRGPCRLSNPRKATAMTPYYPARDGHPSIFDPEAAKLSPLDTVRATDERDAIEKVEERNIPYLALGAPSCGIGNPIGGPE